MVHGKYAAQTMNVAQTVGGSDVGKDLLVAVAFADQHGRHDVDRP